MAIKFLRELSSIWSRQHRNWKTVVTHQVVGRFFYNMVIQYSNIYIRELGASPVELGAVNSASGFARTVISLPLGLIRDRYSVRKIYLFGIALAMLSPLLYAVAQRWEFVVFAILISGISMPLGSCDLICNLLLPDRDRTTGKSLCEGIGALPVLIAPTIAAVLVMWFGGITVSGIRPLYWIQFVSRVVLFVYVSLKMVEIVRPKQDFESFTRIGSFGEVFEKGKAVKRWLLFTSLNTFTSTMLLTFRYPYAYEVKGATPFIISGIVTAMILTQAIFSTPFGRLGDKIGRKKMFYILTPLFSMANILFAVTPFPEFLLLAGFLLGFRMISILASGAITAELVPSSCMGRWIGLIGLVSGLASIPAPIIGGLIWENLGPEWVFIIPTLIDLLIRLPLLHTIPETLNRS